MIKQKQQKTKACLIRANYECQFYDKNLKYIKQTIK